MSTEFDMMNGFLEEKKAACLARVAALQAESRGADADLEKIRANIYDIFTSVISAAEKAIGDGGVRERDFFLASLERIPASWRAAYDQAMAHDDEPKAHIESIKLEAIDDIRAQAEKIWGGAK